MAPGEAAGSQSGHRGATSYPANNLPRPALASTCSGRSMGMGRSRSGLAGARCRWIGSHAPSSTRDKDQLWAAKTATSAGPSGVRLQLQSPRTRRSLRAAKPSGHHPASQPGALGRGDFQGQLRIKSSVGAMAADPSYASPRPATPIRSWSLPTTRAMPGLNSCLRRPLPVRRRVVDD